VFRPLGCGLAVLLGFLASVAAAEPAAGTAERPLIVAQGDSLGVLADHEHAGNGISVECLDAVAKRAGIITHREIWPWQRAQAMVEQGVADLFVTVPTAERKAYAIFAEHPLFQAETVVLYNKTGPLADRIAAARALDDLKGIAFVAYLGSGWTNEALAGQQVTWVNDRPTVMSMIAAGHADASLSDNLLSHSIIDAAGLGDKIATHRIDSPHPHYYYIGIRRSLPGAEALLARFDAATEAAEQDGTLAAILNRYETTDGLMP
jgi:polar amino acid transport system substrate-binding protein